MNFKLLAGIVSLLQLGCQAAPQPLNLQDVLSSKGKPEGLLNDLVNEGLFRLDSISSDIQDAWKQMELVVKKDEIRHSLNDYMTGKCFPKASFPVESKINPENSELFKLDELPNYQLRVNTNAHPEKLGIDSVKQSAGYFDINEEDKHLYYWFFESRNDPANDPVILWLNGGPGCSSMTGLFFELGPSFINDSSATPIYNPYSWNTNASVIFLEQPVGVGYSYADKSSVSSTAVAAKDVYAFLQLFFSKNILLADNDFHIAGESYAGHYIPNIASEIVNNEERIFDLTSVLIGNGITDPLVQYGWYGPMACNGTLSGYKQIIPDEDCAKIDQQYPRCARLIQACYALPNALTCLPANLYCERILDPFVKTGLNFYDIRTTCGDSDLCYKELDYVDQYLNLPEVMSLLGAEVDSYTGCDETVFRNFILTGDEPKPFQQYVAEILDKNVPVLIYAGDKDYICNWLGNLAWSEKLEWTKSWSFQDAEFKDWYSNIDGAHAGKVKSNGQFTFLRVFDAGHMVPHDQPSNSLDFVNRWIAGDYTYSN